MVAVEYKDKLKTKCPGVEQKRRKSKRRQPAEGASGKMDVYGAGMLRVVLSLVSYFAPAAAESSTYQLFDFMSQAPFLFYADSGSLWNIKSIESKPRFFNRYGSGAFIPEFYRYDGSRRSSDNDETSGLFNDIWKYCCVTVFLGNTGSLS